MPSPREVPALSATIGRQVRYWRRRRDWSGSQLVERVRELGLPFTRAVLTNIEAERRDDVGVRELFAIAYVLGVPPVQLILPLGIEEQVEIVPGVPAHPDLARKWLIGDEPPFALPDGTEAGGVALGDRVDFWRQAATAVRLYDRLDAAQDLDDLGAIFAVLTEMGRAGVLPPALTAAQVKALRQMDTRHELPELRELRVARRRARAAR